MTPVRACGCSRIPQSSTPSRVKSKSGAECSFPFTNVATRFHHTHRRRVTTRREESASREFDNPDSKDEFAAVPRNPHLQIEEAAVPIYFRDNRHVVEPRFVGLDPRFNRALLREVDHFDFPAIDPSTLTVEPQGLAESVTAVDPLGMMNHTGVSIFARVSDVCTCALIKRPVCHEPGNRFFGFTRLRSIRHAQRVSNLHWVLGVLRGGVERP